MSPIKPTILAFALALGCGTRSNTKAECAPPQEGTPSVAAVHRVTASATSVDDLQAAFKKAIAAAGPSVVSIYSTKTVTFGPHRFPFEGTPFGDFFRFHMPERELEQRGLGSGFILDAQGHILTNNHVVAGADEIRVKLADDREFEATVVGTDPPTDLALLRIEADDLHPIDLGDSDGIEVGDWVLAIGNPFGLPQTVSAGIVSAKGRANVGIVDYEDFIQTDTAINPGNSGGPLVDLEGRVVGINTAIASRSGGNNGIAFAIPVNMAKSVVEQLLDGGRVIRGHLGILITELSPELAESFSYQGKHGILVQDVVKDGPAASSGLQSGDIITSLDGRAVTTVPEFRTTIARTRPGSTVRLGVWREGKEKVISVELGELPTSSEVSSAGEPPKLGIVLQDADPRLRRELSLDDGPAVVITEVKPGSPAARAGLRRGDVLEQIGKEDVRNAAQATKLLRELDLGKGVRLRIRRDGTGRFVYVRSK